MPSRVRRHPPDAVPDRPSFFHRRACIGYTGVVTFASFSPAVVTGPSGGEDPARHARALTTGQLMARPA